MACQCRRSISFVIERRSIEGAIAHTVKSMTSLFFASNSFCAGSAFMASSCTFSDSFDSPLCSCFAVFSACASEYHRCPANRDDTAGAKDLDAKGEDEVEETERCWSLGAHCCVCWRASVWRVRERRWLIILLEY